MRSLHAILTLILAAALSPHVIEAQELTEPISYKLESVRRLSRFTPDQISLLAKLNHADPAHLGHLPRIVVPDRWEQDELIYSPMPKTIEQIGEQKKAIIVDLRAQVFGAYELGKLVRWGPVSSGDRQHETPSGIYHLNWRARVHASTEDPTWIMPWYFNFANDEGLALHQYEMPGRPASHGCVRMLESDARWLYEWGEEWSLADETKEITREGTLVLLVGSYDFTSSQPWLRPEWWDEGVVLPSELYDNLSVANTSAPGDGARP
jgi:lipoprotein-anchoring transpeptidase ErfK/SrfK